MPKAASLAFLACMVVALGSGAAAAPKRGMPDGRVSALGGYALPSEIVASSIAWGRIAGDKGWSNAVRAMAVPDAQILIGSAFERAQALAKSHAAPAALPHRRTHHVWMSCDGSIGVEEGLFEDGAAHGWYVTVWQHQVKKGEYRWVLDQRGLDSAAAPDFDFIEGKVADCVPHARGEAPKPVEPGSDGAIEVKPMPPGTPPPITVKGEASGLADYLSGISRDQTLRWATRLDPDGTRHVTVNMLVDGKRTDVLSRSAPAER
jgi:hypothetical protein